MQSGIRGTALGLIMFRLITQAIWLKARNDRGRKKKVYGSGDNEMIRSICDSWRIDHSFRLAL